ncbi:MAG: hypothetical protein BACD_00115 [Bacteroides rodentium]
MTTAIIYASTHHGNTEKLVKAIAGKHPDVTLIDATKSKEADLSKYDVIGFASGIYAGKFHQSVLNFASVNLPHGKKVFFIYTSAMNTDFTKSIKKALEGKNAAVLGHFGCKGYNTFGPFKLVGGTSKGHPDQKDLDDVMAFYEKISEE